MESISKSNSRSYCFFCSASLLYQIPINEAFGSGIKVLQDLARRLKANLRNEDGDGVVGFNCSEEEVPLCSNCSKLSTNVSRLFGILEKVKMELSYCLELMEQRMKDKDNQLGNQKDEVEPEKWTKKLKLREEIRAKGKREQF